MKKTVCAALALMLALMLTACGVPQEKLDAVKEKHNELSDLYMEAGVKLDDMEALGFELPSDAWMGFDEVGKNIAENDEIVKNDLKKLNEAQVDQILATLDDDLEQMELLLQLLDKLTVYLEKAVEVADLYQQCYTLAVEADSAGLLSDEAADKINAITDAMLDMENVMDGVDDEDFDAMFEALDGAIDKLDEILGELTALMGELS